MQKLLAGISAKALAILGLWAIAGCSRIDTAHWTEEVQLHDGKMIVVERIARAHPRGLLSDTRGADIDFEIKYEPLGVHWKGTRQQDALEIFDGVAYVVTTVGNEAAFCKDKPLTALPISILKQQGKEWVEVEPSTFPVSTARMNLYREYWGNQPGGDAKGLVTRELKSEQVTLELFFRRNNLTCARFKNN